MSLNLLNLKRGVRVISRSVCVYEAVREREKKHLNRRHWRAI